MKLWKGNMDIQFILNPYSCARYISAYISKCESGVSKLLKAIAEEINKGNLSVKERLWKYGNCFLNGSEISAQEAAYGVLGMPLVMSSKAFVFIP